MEHQINRYAGLRVAKLTGAAHPEQLLELEALTATLPEEFQEEAEMRVAAVMPAIRKESRHAAH